MTKRELFFEYMTGLLDTAADDTNKRAQIVNDADIMYQRNLLDYKSLDIIVKTANKITFSYEAGRGVFSANLY